MQESEEPLKHASRIDLARLQDQENPCGLRIIQATTN